MSTIIRRIRESGLLPSGAGGRNGVNSARLDTRHVALILLAMAARAWCAPVKCPAEARRLSSFRLRGGDEKLIDVMAGSIAAVAGALDGYAPDCWAISQHEARQETFGLVFGDDGLPDHETVVRSTVIPPGGIVDIAELFSPATVEAA